MTKSLLFVKGLSFYIKNKGTELRLVNCYSTNMPDCSANKRAVI